MIKTDTIPYRDGAVILEGFAAYSLKKNCPLVILCHAWKGQDDFIREKAKVIASWGYTGFALDMYGKGVLGTSAEECAALKRPFSENRLLLQKRVLRGFEIACNIPHVDSTRISCLGFGFGGMCALDLARSGVHLNGAISVYGHFEPSTSFSTKPITAKILALHGYKDPIVAQKEVAAFEKEMCDAKVDWQMHVYGNAMHAFATPGANAPESGIQYHDISAKRAWKAIQNFLEEIF